MPRLEAKRFREQANLMGARLTADQVYDLTLAETESREKAENAMADYIAAQLRANERPE